MYWVRQSHPVPSSSRTCEFSIVNERLGLQMHHESDVEDVGEHRPQPDLQRCALLHSPAHGKRLEDAKLRTPHLVDRGFFSTHPSSRISIPPDFRTCFSEMLTPMDVSFIASRGSAYTGGPKSLLAVRALSSQSTEPRCRASGICVLPDQSAERSFESRFGTRELRRSRMLGTGHASDRCFGRLVAIRPYRLLS